MTRHLPIVKQKPAPAPGSVPAPMAEDDRPPWHWSGIGAVLVFTLWLPLAMVGQWLTRRLIEALVPESALADVGAFLATSSSSTRFAVRASLLGPQLAMFVLAAATGGALVGKFGGKAGTKEATVAGLVAATTAWALTAVTTGLSTTWFLWPPAAAIGAASAWLGGKIGVRLRAK